MKAFVTDAAVRSLIAELRETHGRVTGVQIRAELRRRHGSPSSVSRIYRLLNEEQIALLRQSSSPKDHSVEELENTIRQLREQLAKTLERAERAEHREQVHQDKWAVEVDSMRVEIHKLKTELKERVGEVRRHLDLYQELGMARRRIVELEEQIQTLSANP